MSRVPIRLRLTAVFVLAMAAILAATGLFLHLRLASSLDETIDDGLRSRADDVAALVRGSPGDLADGVGLQERDESFAQVLTRAGRVADGTEGLEREPVLSPAERRRAAAGPLFAERATSPAGDDDAVRMLAVPVEVEAGGRIVVVGTSLEARSEALDGLFAQLLVGGPLALALAGALAYWLAAAALRPVETMRREAAAIGGDADGRRLPVPAVRDEVSRLGETLNAMLDRQETALARERRFLADASHELRTPLALLRGELELALRRGRPREELESSLRSAAEESERLARLADDLLLLARGDQGRLAVAAEELDAGELLQAAADRFRARAKALRRELVVAGDRPRLVADRRRLEQVVDNLVDNALRHGRGTVTLRADEVGGRVELHVLDEGGGFGDFAGRAFQRFARADEARSGEGAGLGLAIAAAIARAHGGDVGLDDRPGGGADVWISLPARP